MQKVALGILAVAVVGYTALSDREIRHAPGAIAPDAPAQYEVDDAAPFELNGYRITRLAELDLEARVLSTERYRFDREADLSPLDLALGWGPMSSQPILDTIDISQRGRFYFWQSRELPIPPRAVATHSANMHMIPAGTAVERVLLDARVGHVVRIRGYLVSAQAPDGWRWTSSLTRSDTGNGACELVYVESVELS